VLRLKAWHKEAWRYGSYGSAMAFAECIMEQERAQAAVVEQIDPTYNCGPVVSRGSYRTLGAMHCYNNDPWNWKQEDWQRGMRVRERARKKHRQE